MIVGIGLRFANPFQHFTFQNAVHTYKFCRLLKPVIKFLGVVLVLNT